MSVLSVKFYTSTSIQDSEIDRAQFRDFCKYRKNSNKPSGKNAFQKNLVEEKATELNGQTYNVHRFYI